MMAVDYLSPIAPVRVRVLLLPVGKIRRSRFLSFGARLQAENVVRLGDTSPDSRPNRNMFSPLAYPTGMILYDLSYSVPPTSHIEVFPFEIFREPLAILAIADGAELSKTSQGRASEAVPIPGSGAKKDARPPPEGLDELLQALGAVREKSPRALVHQLLVFDYPGVDKLDNGPDDVLWIPRPDASKATTIKTALCDITSLFLGELDGFAKTLQNLPSIDSPKLLSWGPYRGPEIRPRPVDKLMHRKTMPVQLPSDPTGLSEVPPSSHSSPVPVDHETPTTFDEITRSIQLANRMSATVKSNSLPSSKEHSRDRMSVGGLGASERSKSRHNGRLAVVIGSLYLQAGRWPDALKELVDAATISRASSDYLWHAKALEMILLCLLMLGWAGVDFQVPSICYPVGEKSKALASLEHISAHSSAGNWVVSLQNLANLLPDLSNNIINLYNRSATFTDEWLPPLILSETVIRLTRLLVAARTRGGILDDNALKHIVLNEPLIPHRLPEHQKGVLSLRRADILSFLFQALPLSATADLPATDIIPVMVGVVSVLGSLDLSRKKAFVMRELLSIMVQSLVQARKIGAAEVGIHPATGLSSLNATSFEVNSLDCGPGNMEESIRVMLTKLGDIYGVQRLSFSKCEKNKSSNSSGGQLESNSEYDSVEAIAHRTFRHVALDGYGDLRLKIDILKACISCCEALPDFNGVLRFTVELLQTIRGDLMLAGTYRTPLCLPPDEQIRLFNNIQRTVEAAQKLGASNLEAEYWDDFLVRGVEVLPLSDAKKLARRSKTELDVITAKPEKSENDPFLYNPFSKATSKTTELLMVVGEKSSLKVTLQNPYEFEVEIENLSFENHGVSLNGGAENILLPPLSLVNIVVPAVAEETGTLRISACIVKVQNCRRRKFPIFRQLWRPEPEKKFKRTGLEARKPFSERPLSWTSATSRDGKPLSKGPQTEICEIKVVGQQPSLVIESLSLSQSAMMILEGERKTFDITLLNISKCPLDFIVFTFQDSTTRQLQSALSNKDLLPAEIYELELKLSTERALRWRRDNLEDKPLTIQAGEKATFTVEVLGKPGLQNATVQIDYSYTNAKNGELPDVFYTRQLLVPLTVTVNASIEVTFCDLVPLSGDFAWRNSLDSNADVDSGKVSPALQSSQLDHDISSILSCLGRSLYGSDHCVFLLELRNAWPSPLSASISALEHTAGSCLAHSSNNDLATCYSISRDLQPGQSSRFVLVLPRIYLSNPHTPIPLLDAGSRRQFVVSANKLTLEAEAGSREAFWFREELLRRLSGTWHEHSTGRSGTIDLRNIRLNRRMVDAMRLDDIEISFSVKPAADESGAQHAGAAVKQFGRFKFQVKTEEMLHLTTTVRNRSSTAIHPLIRLQPAVRNQPNNIALDLSRRLGWTGMLQQVLPVVRAGESTQATIGVTILSRGEYEFGASVEEVRLLKKESDAPGFEADVLTSHPHDGAVEDSFGADVAGRRRIWHAVDTCILNTYE